MAHEAWLKPYLVYCFAIALAALSSLLSALVISSIPMVGIVLFYVFREAAGTGEYLFFFGILSIPAIFVFHWVMKANAFELSLGGVIICWLAGLSTVALLIPQIAGPRLDEISGILIFFGLAASLGFALARFLHFNHRSLSASASNQDALYPEWEDYS